MSVYDGLPKDDKKKIEFLLKETERNNGLAPLDKERFWAEQEKSFSEPFGNQISQVAFGVFPTGDCVFDELGIEEDFLALY